MAITVLSGETIPLHINRFDLVKKISMCLEQLNAMGISPESWSDKLNLNLAKHYPQPTVLTNISFNGKSGKLKLTFCRIAPTDVTLNLWVATPNGTWESERTEVVLTHGLYTSVQFSLSKGANSIVYLLVENANHTLDGKHTLSESYLPKFASIEKLIETWQLLDKLQKLFDQWNAHDTHDIQQGAARIPLSKYFDNVCPPAFLISNISQAIEEDKLKLSVTLTRISKGKIDCSFGISSSSLPNASFATPNQRLELEQGQTTTLEFEIPLEYCQNGILWIHGSGNACERLSGEIAVTVYSAQHTQATANGDQHVIISLTKHIGTPSKVFCALTQDSDATFKQLATYTVHMESNTERVTLELPIGLDKKQPLYLWISDPKLDSPVRIEVKS